MVNEEPADSTDLTWKTSLKRSLGRRLTARSKLLDWASCVVGLPLTDISQVQNGAVFCYILSAFGELDVSHVQFLAVEEQEYSANYRLLQAAGVTREMPGLNARAKLRHWLRLAQSEADAWQFLAVLRIRFAGVKQRVASVKIEPDATPPPAPVPPKKGIKRGSSNFSTMTSVNSTGQCWREMDFSSSGSSDGFSHSSCAADTLSTAETKAPGGVLLQTSDTAKLAVLDRYADTPSTQKARTCLMQMLICKKDRLTVGAQIVI